MTNITPVNLGYSPTVKKLVPEQKIMIEMHLLDALRHLANNANSKVTKLSWPKDSAFIYFKDNNLVINYKGEHSWIINTTDLDGDDWVVVK